MKIEVTKEIAKEINQSINEFQSLINDEMNYSEHLRKHDKIKLYEQNIERLKHGLEKGWI